MTEKVYTANKTKSTITSHSRRETMFSIKIRYEAKMHLLTTVFQHHVRSPKQYSNILAMNKMYSYWKKGK